MDKVKQIYNFSDEAALNSAEIIFKVIDDTTNPVIDFEQRNIDRNTVEIWTGTGSTGTKLIESTDYDFTRSNDAASASTEKFIVNGITIINPSYYDTDLYIPVGTLSGYGDVIDETDMNRLQDQFTGLQAGFNFLDGDCSTLSVVEQYSTYNDGAVSAPVDGEGGTATLLTLSLETSSPLIGLGSLLLTKGSGDAQGQGMSSKDFTIDEGVRGKTTELKFVYKTSDDYAAGDIGMYLYDVDNSTLLYPSVVDMPTADNAGDFFATFITTLTGGNYRLIWHVQTTNALAYTMLVDKIEVGQFNYALGDGHEVYDTGWVANSDWVNAQLSVLHNFGAPLSGIDVKFLISSDGTDNNSFEIKDTAFDSSSAADRHRGYIINQVTTNEVLIQSGSQGIEYLTSLGLTALLSTQAWYYKVVVTKIVKNINLATDFTEYASNSDMGNNDSDETTTSYGIEGSLLPTVAYTSAWNKKISFKNQRQVGDRIVFEFIDINGTPVEYMAHNYLNGGSGTGLIINNQSSVYGITYWWTDATTINIRFNINRYAGAGWDTFAGGCYYRVRKISNGNMAEVPRMVRAEYKEVISTSGVFDYGTKIEDTHNAVTVGTSWRFTAPIDGIYSGDGNLYYAADNKSVLLRKNGVAYTTMFATLSSGGRWYTYNFNIRLNTGDYIDIYSSGTYASNANTRIAITRIGN